MITQKTYQQRGSCRRNGYARLREGATPGYPRFKPRRRYRCLELAEVRPGMLRPSADGRRALLRVKRLPALELRLRRALPPREQLKGLRIFVRGEKLYVDLVFAVEVEALQPSGRAVGIDLGVNQRLALSGGTLIAGRTADRRRERGLRRALARSRRGSHTRAKRRAALARETQRNRLRTCNATHELTSALVRRYGRIAHEALQIGNMTRSARGTVEQPGSGVAAKRALNRRILEQSSGLVIQQLTCEAASAGRELVTVDPACTSRSCSGCGARTPHLQYRVHSCQDCGAVLDRDVNAARNILARAFPDAAVASAPSQAAP